MKIIRVAAVVLALGLVAGCGGSKKASSAASTSAPPAATGDEVTISGFAFHPSPLTVHVGDTVTVTNRDTSTHTFTADDHSFDTGRVAPGTSAHVKLTKAGTLTYHCSIHSFMTGVIHVS